MNIKKTRALSDESWQSRLKTEMWTIDMRFTRFLIPCVHLLFLIPFYALSDLSCFSNGSFLFDLVCSCPESLVDSWFWSGEYLEWCFAKIQSERGWLLYHLKRLRCWGNKQKKTHCSYSYKNKSTAVKNNNNNNNFPSCTHSHHLNEDILMALTV